MFRTDYIEKVRLLFRKERESYLRLYEILGFYPHTLRYYKEAFLHKSIIVRGDKGHLVNNERLEFLGDAILDAIVADIVYKHFEGKHEGFLTNARSKIVQRDTLNRVAVAIGLDKMISQSPHGSNHNSYIYGNAFEALVGAIYLDRGYDYCMRFMEERILGQHINLNKTAYKEVNFKSKLIEWGQKNRVSVEYVLVDQSSDISSPVFHTEVRIEGLTAGEGTGYSKKESQQVASKRAMQKLKDSAFLDSVYAAKEQRSAAEQGIVEQDTASAEQQIPSEDEMPLSLSEELALCVDEQETLSVAEESFSAEQEPQNAEASSSSMDMQPSSDEPLQPSGSNSQCRSSEEVEDTVPLSRQDRESRINDAMEAAYLD